MEKKSERLEVRLSHSDKQAFQSACDETGETPSDVVRRFIRRYIRRADADRLAEGWVAMRAMAGRNVGKLAVVGVGLLAVGGLLVWGLPGAPTMAGETQAWPPYERDLFAKYDKDGDGYLRPGDIRADDLPLFKVLDLDASGAIDVQEFISEAVMVYIQLQDKSVYPDRPRLFSSCEGRGDSTQDFQIVVFDLGIMDHTMLVETKLTGHIRSDGSIGFSGSDRMVVWDLDNKPCMLMNNPGYEPRPNQKD